MSQSEMPAATSRRYDIIVVGAGVAGLAAAQALSESGASVALLEARPRVGGRVWTKRTPAWPVPLERGAEFIHGRNAELFAAARLYGLQAVRLPEGHVERRGSRLRPLTDIWDRFDAIARRLPRRGRDRSVADFLRARRGSLSAEDRRFFTTMVEGFDAAPVESAGAQALSTAGEPPVSDDDRGQFRLIGGYGSLVEALAARIDSDRCRLLCDTVVRRIAWRRGRVEVATTRGSLRAPRVLVTVPVGVLRARPGSAGSIAFDPEPGPLRRALSGLAMGEALRLVLRFRQPIWRDAPRVVRARVRENGGDPNFFHFPGAPYPTWWTCAPVEEPVLTAWAGGPAATALSRLPVRARVRCALETLATALALPMSAIRRNLLDWDFHDWTADPYARGAYSFALVGGADAGRRLGRPIEKTLYFAGEAIHEKETGTVPAALASGRNAARRLLR